MAKLRELRETNSQSLIRNTTKEQPNNVDNLETGELNNSKSVEQNTRSFADEQTRVNSEGMSAKVAKFDEVKNDTGNDRWMLAGSNHDPAKIRRVIGQEHRDNRYRKHTVNQSQCRSGRLQGYCRNKVIFFAKHLAGNV